MHAINIAAAYRQSHVFVEQARDAGEAGKSLPCFLCRHPASQSRGAAIYRALVDWPTPADWPSTQELHRFGYAINFFGRTFLPARNTHRRKELQAIHCFLPVDRYVPDRTFKLTVDHVVSGKQGPMVKKVGPKTKSFTSRDRNRITKRDKHVTNRCPPPHWDFNYPETEPGRAHPAFEVCGLRSRIWLAAADPFGISSPSKRQWIEARNS